MKLSKALKQKNLQATKVKQLVSRLVTNNSVNVGRTASYNSRNVLKEYELEREKLVNLKTKISNATQPIQGKIFLMAELKILIQSLRSMDTTEGEEESYHRQTPIMKKAEIKEIEKDEMIENLEKQIQDLQDEIDTHNNSTDVDL